MTVRPDLQVGAQTDHRVEADGDRLLVLTDCATGQPIATAVLFEGMWKVRARGGPPMPAATRAEAITALTEAALRTLGGSGYSTLVPRGLAETP